MARETIGNPLSWSAQRLAGMGRGFGAAVDGIGSHDLARPQVNRIGTRDVRWALRRGLEDFAALRSDVVFAVALYPAVGFVLALWALRGEQIHLLFPLLAGFALVGPIAAVVCYEMSRRREMGMETGWGAAMERLTGRLLGPVLALALALLAVFGLWIFAAHVIWSLTLGPEPAAGLGALLRDALTTGAGWAMIVVGMGVGFLFAAAVLCLSLVSFPLLIDRPVGVPVALATSVEVVRRNPRAAALWGLVVAAALAVGTIPLFMGLVIVLPVLGHATWHLYRRAVAPAA